MNPLLLPVRRSCLLFRCISTAPLRGRNAGVKPRRTEARFGEQRRDEPRRGGFRRDNFERDEPRRGGFGRDEREQDEPRRGGFRRNEFEGDEPRRGGFRRDEREQDEPRRGGFRRSEFEGDEPRRGGFRRDEREQDEPRRGGFRRNEFEGDEPRRGSFRRDEREQDEPRRGGFRRGEFERDVPRPGGFRRDEFEQDEPRRGGSRRDEPRREVSRREEPRREEPRQAEFQPDEVRRDDAPRSEPTKRVSKSQPPKAEAGSSPSVPTVILKEGKARVFSAEAPLVFSGAVQKVTGSPGVGDSVMLADDMRNPLGWGVFNPHSMYQVRMMQYREPAALEPFAPSLDQSAHVHDRLARALARRAAIRLPSVETDAFRLVSSEGDALSGLVVDAYADHLVMSVTAGWVQLQKDAVIRHAFDLTGARGIIWRPSTAMLRKEGVEVKSDASYHTREQPAGVDNPGAIPSVMIKENGMSFDVNLLSQKTGFYCDQRDNRDLVRTLAGGKAVLDLCCFSGGFAVAAAVGGAAAVTGIDSSSAAIAAARRNADLNGVGPLCNFVEDDVDEWMARQLEDPAAPRYDIIVLDPPKLAPSAKDLRRALQKYRRLNALAMGLIQPAGGLLLTCSCSGAVTQSDSFPYMLVEAAQAARRSAVQLQLRGAAGCHLQHLTFAEGNYLIASLLHVS